MSLKGGQVRVKAVTMAVINMLAGEFQAATGGSISIDDALQKHFSETRPDLVERAEKQLREAGNKGES